jgi:hypothetical protein
MKSIATFPNAACSYVELVNELLPAVHYYRFTLDHARSHVRPLLRAMCSPALCREIVAGADRLFASAFLNVLSPPFRWIQKMVLARAPASLAARADGTGAAVTSYDQDESEKADGARSARPCRSLKCGDRSSVMCSSNGCATVVRLDRSDFMLVPHESALRPKPASAPASRSPFLDAVMLGPRRYSLCESIGFRSESWKSLHTLQIEGNASQC